LQDELRESQKHGLRNWKYLFFVVLDGFARSNRNETTNIPGDALFCLPLAAWPAIPLSSDFDGSSQALKMMRAEPALRLARLRDHDAL